MKKLLVVGIIVLLVGVSIPTTGRIMEQPFTVSSDENTLYVGGSGPGNFSKIKDAIDNASDGDTVFVYNGTYIENIIVKKSINLIGEEKNITIIDGNNNGNVIFINADYVTIKNFTIKNCKDSGDAYQYAVIKIISHNNIVINDNIISTGDLGGFNDWTAAIYLRGTSNNYIQNNIIFNEEVVKRTHGIVLNDYNAYNNISGNEISMYLDGVQMYSSEYPECNNNTLYGNYIHNNWQGIVSGGVKNKIINNAVSSNLDNGLLLYHASDMTVSGNIVINNGEGGEFQSGIALEYSINNLVTKNIITNNNLNGIHVFHSYHNIITQNDFIENDYNSYDGLFFWNKWLRNSNKWESNYWDDWIGLRFSFLRFIPYRIGGQLFSLNYDWHPAKEPHDIEV